MILHEGSTLSDSPQERSKRQSRSRGWRFVVWVLAAAALLAIVVRAAFVDFYYIGSGSMRPSLEEGDGLLVSRTAYLSNPPARGDVVVFDGRGSLLPYDRDNAAGSLLRALRLAGDDAVFVKRVMAVGGDTISCCDDDGALVLNGAALDEPYLSAVEFPSEQRFTATVPEGRIWVMGDNRSDSTDSRALLGAPGGGMIPEDRVIGRVDRIVWPPERSGPLQREGTQ